MNAVLFVILQYMTRNLLKICCSFVTGILVAVTSYGQQQVILEEVRCYSAVGPLPDYLRNPAINASLASQLQQILYQERGWRLTDSLQLPVSFPQLNELKREAPRHQRQEQFLIASLD